jgi:hypothetical protein
VRADERVSRGAISQGAAADFRAPTKDQSIPRCDVGVVSKHPGKPHLLRRTLLVESRDVQDARRQGVDAQGNRPTNAENPGARRKGTPVSLECRSMSNVGLGSERFTSIERSLPTVIGSADLCQWAT